MKGLSKKSGVTLSVAKGLFKMLIDASLHSA
jgi:hypothetical protein